MPQKVGSGFHLPGNVRVVDENIFAKLVENVNPVLNEKCAGPKILIPPLPRYLVGGCCSSNAHCCNRSSPGYGTGQLEDLTRIRNQLKTLLLARGTKNFRVIDSLAAVTGFTFGSDRPGNKELLPLLSHVFARDSVHLNCTCLKNLCKHIFDCITSLAKSASVSFVPGPGAKRTYYWRGFSSPHGSALRVKQHYFRSGTAGPPTKKRR